MPKSDAYTNETDELQMRYMFTSTERKNNFLHGHVSTNLKKIDTTRSLPTCLLKSMLVTMFLPFVDGVSNKNIILQAT